jgi:hypothetical protein
MVTDAGDDAVPRGRHFVGDALRGFIDWSTSGEKRCHEEDPVYVLEELRDTLEMENMRLEEAAENRVAEDRAEAENRVAEDRAEAAENRVAGDRAEAENRDADGRAEAAALSELAEVLADVPGNEAVADAMQ